VTDDLEYHKVCELDDVWEGEMELFDVGENEVLIIHSPGMELRAYSPICPHQEFSLFDGELENCVLTCSAHLWQFDVLSGEGVNPTGTSLTSYPIKVEDEAIWVAFPDNDKDS
jgi:toluene monooxygenase system ferredoxin subunit